MDLNIKEVLVCFFHITGVLENSSLTCCDYSLIFPTLNLCNREMPTASHSEISFKLVVGYCYFFCLPIDLSFWPPIHFFLFLFTWLYV